MEAFLFDLDGTLLQSEKLKAQAYAIAAQKLLGLPEPDRRAFEAYRQVVGASGEETARHVMTSLDLEDELRPLLARYQLAEPWQVLSAIRTDIFNEMTADPRTLRENAWPYTVELLRTARANACKTAVVTSSHREYVLHVVHSLEIDDRIDLIVSAGDYTRGKPDPEPYLLAAKKLEVSPQKCLVLEDSVNGVRSAIAAGMHVVAIATPFTHAGLHADELVNDCWVVHEPEKLAGEVRDRIAAIDASKE